MENKSGKRLICTWSSSIMPSRTGGGGMPVGGWRCMGGPMGPMGDIMGPIGGIMGGIMGPMGDI